MHKMTETRYKLKEAEYFLHFTQELFNNQRSEYVYHLNAFVNAARNITFVMQKEYAQKPGFKEWWSQHPVKKDKVMARFVELRNMSVKEKTVREKLSRITQSFGPEGLHVVGHKGPTSVVSEPIRFDGPIQKYGYVTVKDDNGERKVRYDITHDFSVIEMSDHGSKEIKFDSFIAEAKEHFQKLEALVSECEAQFRL
jgi:hypothetical protein